MHSSFTLAQYHAGCHMHMQRQSSMAELQNRAGIGTNATAKLFKPLKQYAEFTAEWLQSGVHDGSHATMPAFNPPCMVRLQTASKLVYTRAVTVADQRVLNMHTRFFLIASKYPCMHVHGFAQSMMPIREAYNPVMLPKRHLAQSATVKIACLCF